MPPASLRLTALLFVATLGLSAVSSSPVRAEVFKCRDANGKTIYADRPCTGTREAYQPRELNRIPAERLTGQRAAATGEKKKSGWTSPLDPVANCAKRGGKFSREMRGCLLP
ncbi:MAG: DUF4124 domain-containing protein [Lautropia sp.]